MLSFKELEALRRFLFGLNRQQLPSLLKYHDDTSNGFYHRHDRRIPGHFSTASTATCVLSLAATGKWASDPWATRTADLATALLESEWSSADLPSNNIFTVSFILEAVTVLERSKGHINWTNAQQTRLAEAERLIVSDLQTGAASLQGYPPSAYLTQLAVRAIAARVPCPLTPDLSRSIEEWAWREIDHQLALLGSKSKIADLFQLIYAVILVSRLGEEANATPDQSAILSRALQQFFERQLADGTWPLSRPLFHYPGVGSAYCFDYEMLAQLLQEKRLLLMLIEHLPRLSNTAYALQETAFRLDIDALGWSSGHHPQLKGPESWSTASVFHFAHVLDRVVAEAIRKSVFDYLDTVYEPPTQPKTDPADFAPSFLDCTLYVHDEPGSLRSTIYDRFVSRIATDAPRVQAGESLLPSTPMSMILFGPPGTSKTELTRLIADYLRWPLITLNPSYFVRNGMDQVQAEADRLFSMLAATERIVVLLDEFDEMVRERSTAGDILSRFLTTAMLPRLATINKTRRIVFVVATNYIDQFDLAISRPGRFDAIIQLSPPTADAKLRHWPEVQTKLNALSVPLAQVAEKLSLLTYDEFRALRDRLTPITTTAAALQEIDNTANHCTMNQKVEGGDKATSWSELCTIQRRKVRVP